MRKSMADCHGETAIFELQIFELWSATFIDGANFAINDRSGVRQGVGD